MSDINPKNISWPSNGDTFWYNGAKYMVGGPGRYLMRMPENGYSRRYLTTNGEWEESCRNGWFDTYDQLKETFLMTIKTQLLDLETTQLDKKRIYQGLGITIQDRLRYINLPLSLEAADHIDYLEGQLEAAKQHIAYLEYHRGTNA